jgi:hypothetical protein
MRGIGIREKLLRRVFAAVLTALMALTMIEAASDAPLPEPRVKVLESRPLRIDRLMPSMTGPYERIDLVDPSELGWVVGYRAEVLDLESSEPMGDEFFCHSQLQLGEHTRLFVTATGASGIRFPAGFGMPVGRILSSRPRGYRDLNIFGMLLNNHEPEIDRLARIRASIEYYRAEDVPPLKKLYIQTLPMEVQDLAEYVPSGEVSSDVSTHCALVNDETMHWLVPPGTQKTRRRFRDFMVSDWTVHSVAVHLHNHGVYMRLTDLTSGEVLWQADVVNEPLRTQIAEITTYSSAEGFRMYQDHEYEIEAVYNNTTDHDVDAMAMMYLYYNPEGNIDITYPTPLDFLGQ